MNWLVLQYSRQRRRDVGKGQKFQSPGDSRPREYDFDQDVEVYHPAPPGRIRAETAVLKGGYKYLFINRYSVRKWDIA